jgi:hypothetical protein
MIATLVCQYAHFCSLYPVSESYLQSTLHNMIIIVYGSILRPSSNNRAAIVGCHGRQLRQYLPILVTHFSKTRVYYSELHVST